MQPQSKLQAFMHESHKEAMRYVEMGWAVIPISLSDKRPLIPWSEYQITPPSRSVVEGWYSEGVTTESGTVVFGFGLGVITGAVSGVVVVDCDNPEALAAAESLGLTSDFCVLTRRGRHYYFKHPRNGSRYANKAGGNATGGDWPQVPGLDFRGDGGFVVAPPTTVFHKESGEHKHTYTWLDEAELDFSLMPVWSGRPTLQSVASSGFRFESLDLSAVDLSRGTTVEDEIVEYIASIGRKLTDGDGRNNWLTRYAGEQCKLIAGEDLIAKCISFCTRFFAVELPYYELRNTVQSVVAKDRRTHPERYDKHGRLQQAGKSAAGDDKATLPIPTPTHDLKSAPDAFKPILCSDIDDLIRAAGERSYWLEPIIEPNSITQVVGFNGSGKTFVLMNALWAAACGKTFGPFESIRKPRVLYFDWELSLGITADRMKDMQGLFGSPSDNFMLWSAATGNAMNLMSDKGVVLFLQWIEANQPDIVVLDTVRSAFRGMHENSAEEWSRVNSLLKAIRDKGIAVVFVHHRNKPGMNGMGRESGSTAQLTDVDTQIVITKVCQSKHDAMAEAGRYNADTKVYDLSGKSWTAYDYLSLKCKGSYKLKYVAELSYGKLRQPSELHIPHYIGLAVDITNGKKKVVSTLSPKQQARVLHNSKEEPSDIAHKLDIPLPLIERWIE